MHRHNPNSHFPGGSANAEDSSEHARGGGDREGSASGSEGTAGYTPYSYAGRDDHDDLPGIDDPYAALTSQTLNPDGTPKRPMNAFMIYARKRRPQISAANQMMRTGDISKILSKEWTTMPMSEKKFYLDQAKKLKDNFNSKYPDYVYRRRPNNSRRKRKPDGGQTSPTEPSMHGENDDGSMEDVSPVDPDESLRDDTTSPMLFRSSGTSPTYEGGPEPFSTTQVATGYPYPQDFGQGQYGQSSSTRLPALITPGDGSLSASSIAPLKIPSLGETSGAHNYGFTTSTQTHSSSTSAVAGQSPDAQNMALWGSDRSRIDQSRGSSAWPALPALDTSLTTTRQRHGTISVIPSRSDAFSTHVPHRPWSSAASSSTSSSSAGPSFPTLTSPFYPTQSPAQRSSDLVPSPTTHPTSSSEYFSSPTYHRSMQHTPRAANGQEHGGFGPSQSPTLPHPSTSAYLTNPPGVSTWNSQYGRTSADSQQRSLSATQQVSPFALQPPGGTSLTGTQSTQLGYWDRNRFEGR